MKNIVFLYDWQYEVEAVNADEKAVSVTGHRTEWEWSTAVLNATEQMEVA